MFSNTHTFDLLIIGGGLAGLTAGVRALELGLSVALIEKGEGEDYPCNSRWSGGIVHIGFKDPRREPDDLFAFMQKITAGDADPRQMRTIAHNGGRLLDWLTSHGTHFMRFNPQEGYRWCMAPPRALKAGNDWRERGPDRVLRTLRQTFEKKGGLFRTGETATALRMEHGRCVGAVSESAKGQTEWSARSTLIADGGFQSNPELFTRLINTGFDRVFQRGAATGKGSGLLLAQSAGAALRGTDGFYGHILCHDARDNPNVWPYPELDAIATAGIVVGTDGERIADEGRSGVFLTNALATCTKDTPLFAIFDAAIWDGPGRSARIPANPLLEQAGGTVLRANTLAELAQQAGIDGDTLAKTVATYNTALADHQLESLTIPRSSKMKPWPIEQGPFMAIRLLPGITYTMGGIAIDGEARALTEEGAPIPGLLAAGAATGGLEGGQNAAYIGGLMKAGVFGLVAAETAAQSIGRAPSAETKSTQAQPRSEAPTYPVLMGIVAYGRPLGILLAIATCVLVVALGWPLIGGWSLLASAIAGLVIGGLALSYAELVKLVVTVMMPSRDD